MLRQARNRLKTTTPEASQARARFNKFIHIMSNHNIYVSLLSRFSPLNPYDATGYHDKSITSPIEDGISKIKANFGKISQNSLNFVARVGLGTAQKTQKNQKTTASRNSCGFIVPKKGD